MDEPENAIMIKKITNDDGNISQAVTFFLKGAKKRRAVAMASAAALNSGMGLGVKIVAVK